MSCVMHNFIEECQKYHNKYGNGFIVHTPYIAWDENNRPKIVYEFYITQTRCDGAVTETYYPESIIYEDFTPNNVRHTEWLFPDFTW